MILKKGFYNMIKKQTYSEIQIFRCSWKKISFWIFGENFAEGFFSVINSVAQNRN